MAEAESAQPERASAIHKGFVEAQGTLLHYVRRGTGPAVVLLHASPCSARVMAPLQAAWSADFTTFAFDLPGFGLSEAPAVGEVTIEVLAEAIATAMRELGIRNAGVYGRHTGASVGLELARRHPELAAVLLTDGLPIFPTPYDDARLDEYLPPLEPKWDGSHLVWSFFRYREQHVFWPWDRPDGAHRSDADMPELEFLYRGAVELLEAAPNYARVYRSAFRYETLAKIGALQVPAYYGNRPGDSQFRTVERYPEWAEVRIMPRDPEAAQAEELALLKRHPAFGPVPVHRSRFRPSPAHDLLRDYFDTRHGPAYARGAGLARDGVPALFLHDIPGGVDLHQDEINWLGNTGPVVGFDLGGNGNSDLATTPGLELWIEQIEDVLAAMQWSRIRIHAHGTSVAVAAAFARANPGRVASMTLRSAPILTPAERHDLAARYAPDIAPAPDGGNFLRLWHHLRDQELWWPWFDQSHRAIKRSEPRIDPAHLNRRAVTILKQPGHYAVMWRTVLEPDLPTLLSGLTMPFEIIVHAQDVFAHCAQRYAREILGSAPTDVSCIPLGGRTGVDAAPRAS